MKSRSKPATRFTQSLAIVFEENGWNIPEPTVVRVYEEHIRRLEAEIDQLKGDRAGAPTRIDAMEQPAEKKGTQ